MATLEQLATELRSLREANEELRETNDRLQRRVDSLEGTGLIRRIPEGPTRTEPGGKLPELKPSKPQGFDPSSKDSNVRTWLFGVNNYFRALGVAEDQHQRRIDFAVTMLQGPALEWWRHTCMLDARGRPSEEEDVGATVTTFTTPLGAVTRQRMARYDRKPTTWPEFSEALLARFDLVNVSIVARNKLKKLRQLTSVQEYTRRFLALCAECDDLSEAEKRDRYFDGLKLPIQQTLVLHGVEDLPSMMALAERLDALQFQLRTRGAGDKKQLAAVDKRDRQHTKPKARGADGEKKKTVSKDIICYRCQKPGHFARNCRMPAAENGAIQKGPDARTSDNSDSEQDFPASQ
jgi:hypothetical protein